MYFILFMYISYYVFFYYFIILFCVFYFLDIFSLMSRSVENGEKYSIEDRVLSCRNIKEIIEISYITILCQVRLKQRTASLNKRIDLPL